jgi:predicted sugar kinase
VLEDDLEAFAKALDQFSELGFKAREIRAQGPAVRDTIGAMKSIVPCVGMSSMGPLVYTLSRGSVTHTLPTLPPGTVILGQARIASEGFKVSNAQSSS